MFKVRPFENRTLSWWNDERQNVDLSPPYQRSSSIWTRADKAFLIDSILNDFDIPKIYIADFTYVDTALNEKHKSYAVIDGKQRFETIFDFFEGRLTLDSEFVFFRDNELQLAGLSYPDLKKQYPKVASIFENFNLVVMSVITDDEGQINELFTRLNRSKPLTGAELRNAMKGEVPVLIRKLVKHDFFASRIRFGVQRGQDKNAAAKLLLTEFLGKFGETKRKQLDELVKQGVQSESQTYKRASDRVKRGLDKMATVFIPNDPLLGSQGPVVLFYWLIRQTSEEDRNHIREFLVTFDRQVKENRKASADDLRVDEELLKYDVMRRSINNASSQVACYAILERRFKEFVAEKAYG